MSCKTWTNARTRSCPVAYREPGKMIVLRGKRAGKWPQLRQITAGCQEKHWKPLALFLFHPPVVPSGGGSIRGKKAEGKGERAAKTRRVLQVVQGVLPEYPRERGARANHSGRGSVMPHSEPGFPWDAAERRETKQIRLPRTGRKELLSHPKQASASASRSRPRSIWAMGSA